VKRIHLSDNAFNWTTIPLELANHESLHELGLAGNDIHGIIPSEFGILHRLKLLDLSDNNLSGSIPTELGLLSNLEYFILGSNNLKGLLPDELGNLTSVHKLILFNNTLTGEIPTTLGKLGANNSHRKTIDLSENNLRKTIPSELGTIPTLCKFLLLHFSTSSSINSLRLIKVNIIRTKIMLDSLRLHSNDLSGVMPTSICSSRGDAYDDLHILTVDHDKVKCNCCLT
jgi:Leucine-rich repeat (LRR) protein